MTHQHPSFLHHRLKPRPTLGVEWTVPLVCFGHFSSDSFVTSSIASRSVSRSFIRHATSTSSSVAYFWRCLFCVHPRSQIDGPQGIVALTEKALRDGHCCVIGLQSTGESGLNKASPSLSICLPARPAGRRSWHSCSAFDRSSFSGVGRTWLRKDPQARQQNGKSGLDLPGATLPRTRWSHSPLFCVPIIFYAVCIYSIYLRWWADPSNHFLAFYKSISL